MSGVYFLRGDDESLLRDKVTALVAQLVGDDDRSLLIEEFEGEEYELAALVDAAQTMPFLTDRRIVVGRNLNRFTTADAVAPLVQYLGDQLPTTTLVLVWATGRTPKSLLDALKAVKATTIDASPGSNARAQKEWAADQVRTSGLRLDARAQTRLVETLGEDLARITSVLATLRSTFGEGAALSEAEIAPYLGEAGAMAPWELTDALDQGRIDRALDRLHRLLGAGERHALQVLFTIHGHYQRMLALDGSEVRTDKDAAAVLGMKGSTFPAKKAMDQGRRLGSARIRQAIGLIAQADLDLKGGKGWPDVLVMEVLVARLAHLSSAAR